MAWATSSFLPSALMEKPKTPPMTPPSLTSSSVGVEELDACRPAPRAVAADVEQLAAVVDGQV